MAEIKLDQDNREVAQAITKDSVVTCIKTSAKDVYVKSIIFNVATTTLFEGDSSFADKGHTLRVHLFRKNPGNAPFSATVDVSPVSAGPMATMLSVNFKAPVKKGAAKKAKKQTAKAK